MSFPPEQPYPSVPDHPPAEQQWGHQPTYAGWWARVGALLLDALILLVPLFVLGFVLGAALFATGEDDEDAATGAIGVVYAISIVLPYVYYGLTMGRKNEHNGQTLGKQIVGIRIVRQDGRPIGFWWAIGREFIKGIISAVTLGINYLWPLWDKRNQALHDKVMSDFVVRG